MPPKEQLSIGTKAPSKKQLKILFWHSAAPMFGFGLMDNTVMIQAGDFIDCTIGAKLGITTLTAAAFGQVFSDVSGVLFGGTVESAATKLGLPVPKLTRSQRRTRPAKIAGVGGAVFGVVCGCLFAMTQLLFMDLDRADRMRKQKELKTLFDTVMEDGHKLVGAQHCTLWIVDEDGEHIWSRAHKGNRPTTKALRETFRRYDFNRDGYITADELQEGLRRIGRKRSISQAREIIKSFKSGNDSSATSPTASLCSRLKNLCVLLMRASSRR